jgi:thioredoxin 1
MSVVHITTPEQYDELLSTKSKLIIVEFSAQWCGPCKVIQPAYEQFAKQNPHVLFLSVDIDDVPEAADKAEVSAMPTFQVYKDGKMVNELRGASKPALETMIQVPLYHVESLTGSSCTFWIQERRWTRRSPIIGIEPSGMFEPRRCTSCTKRVPGQCIGIEIRCG